MAPILALFAAAAIAGSIAWAREALRSTINGRIFDGQIAQFNVIFLALAAGVCLAAAVVWWGR